MIHSSRIDLVKAQRNKDGPLEGLKIDLQLDSVSLRDGMVEVKFVYTAIYDAEVGFIRLQGSLFSKEDSKYAAAIVEQFKESKTLPDEFAREAVNAISFICSADATLVAQTLGLRPPMFASKISVEKQAGS